MDNIQKGSVVKDQFNQEYVCVSLYNDFDYSYANLVKMDKLPFKKQTKEISIKHLSFVRDVVKHEMENKYVMLKSTTKLLAHVLNSFDDQLYVRNLKTKETFYTHVDNWYIVSDDKVESFVKKHLFNKDKKVRMFGASPVSITIDDIKGSNILINSELIPLCLIEFEK